jgi:competence protein ComGC
MSSINNISNLNSWYIQSTAKVTNSDEQTSQVRNRHQNQDSYQSDINLFQSNQPMSFVIPLNSLVENSTISEDQLTAISDAFRTSSQSNSVYGKAQSNPISSLVASGTITQEQADSIKEAFKAAKPHRKESLNTGSITTSNDPLANLVTAGTITQEQADAIKTALQDTRPPKPPVSPLEDQLNNLVDNGTITEDPLETIMNSFLSLMQKPQEQTSTDTQNDSNATDPVANLVSSGTITQTQADAINSALEAARPPKPPVSPFKEKLSNLVNNGTITDDQLTAIESAFQSIIEKENEYS